MHPYEMYQTLVQRLEHRNVKVSRGSLYHTIDRLARREQLRALGTEREGNRPELTTYEITEAGQLALGERISKILGAPVKEYPEFPLAIGEAHNLPRTTVARLLRARLGRLQAELEVIQESVDHFESDKLPRMYWLDVDYTKTLALAEISWLEHLIGGLESGELPWLDDTQSHK